MFLRLGGGPSLDLYFQSAPVWRRCCVSEQSNQGIFSDDGEHEITVNYNCDRDRNKP